MELKKFLEKIKSSKIKSSLLNLTYDVLKLEELFFENADFTKDIKQLGEVLYQLFLLINEHKIEINNTNTDLDLDNWKNNIKKYQLKNKVSKDIYLYTMRNTLKNLIDVSGQKNEYFIKVHLFELIIKTFLYIDFIDLSIDTIVENKIKMIQSIKEKKEDEIKEIS